VNIAGDYGQSAAATLAVEIGGLSAGEHDRLTVAGTATLGGRLEVSEIGGFEALPGDAFDVLSYGARNGEFSQVDTPAMPPGLLADLIFNDAAEEGTLQFDALAGDANLDGKVNQTDLDMLAANWETWETTGAERAWKLGDFDQSGSIDIGDLALMAGNWQTSLFDNVKPEPFEMAKFEAALERAGSVPEPSTLALLGCLAGVLWFAGPAGRWRRRAA